MAKKKYAVTERTVRKRFDRFKAGDFNLEDQDEDQIKTLIENNPRYTTRKLAEMLNMSKSIIHEACFCEAWLHKLFMDFPRFNGEKSDGSHIHLRLAL